MNVQVDYDINWTWFKVQNDDLVANFRLHHGSKALAAFCVLKKKMTKVYNIEASWRDETLVIANHWKFQKGYDLPEVVEKFGWLSDMFKSVDNPSGVSWGHLEYHGVSILRVVIR